MLRNYLEDTKLQHKNKLSSLKQKIYKKIVTFSGRLDRLHELKDQSNRDLENSAKQLLKILNFSLKNRFYSFYTFVFSNNLVIQAK
jgi:hypothetical protein